jgi:hypothetical protein
LLQPANSDETLRLACRIPSFTAAVLAFLQGSEQDRIRVIVLPSNSRERYLQAGAVYANTVFRRVVEQVARHLLAMRQARCMCLVRHVAILLDFNGGRGRQLESIKVICASTEEYMCLPIIIEDFYSTLYSVRAWGSTGQIWPSIYRGNLDVPSLLMQDNYLGLLNKLTAQPPLLAMIAQLSPLPALVFPRMLPLLPIKRSALSSPVAHSLLLLPSLFYLNFAINSLCSKRVHHPCMLATHGSRLNGDVHRGSITKT